MKPSKMQFEAGEKILIRFKEDYKKPANEGGRVIRKGTEFIADYETAKRYCKILGVAEAILQYEETVPPELEVAESGNKEGVDKSGIDERNIPNIFGKIKKRNQKGTESEKDEEE
jgi:hypothetical protein